MDIVGNIEVRTKVLEYCLIVEDSINSLLITYLKIPDRNTTKLFGKKAGLSFKNKIDLLFDIDVISKDEHLNLELQMNFRNKFLHDIYADSYTIVLTDFDNGIINRFKKHLNNEKASSEDSYKQGYFNLFRANNRMILEKFQSRRKSIEQKADFVKRIFKKGENTTDLFFEFMDKILEELENTPLITEEVIQLSSNINSLCEEYGGCFQKNNPNDDSVNLLNEIKVILH
ncbi:hypothetical protein HQ489_05935 [Candidatus Woesearchaeota archaeon]|nr:hypothetical protein [Candidatus Woesearchaeota archaeon]